ncbi:MAG: ATP-binding protein [Actinomycetota bacterium]
MPIRIRLTAAFALAMGVVVALTGLFVYLRVESGLDRTIDSGLRSRADDVAALVAQADSGLGQGGSGRLAASEESFAQVLRADGGVLDSTPGATRPALDPAEIRALRSPEILDSREVSGIEGQARLLARPVSAQDMRLVVMVGSSISDRDEALDGLVGAFAIGGPLAILLASGAGYLLASFGLAPVDAMRRRAEQVTLSRSGERLPLPQADDEIRRLGETLNAMLARLEGSFERERAFVADASHELRTPLAVLKAELEVTLRGSGYDEDVGAALRTAVEEVDQLASLAEDLLLIARSEDGRVPVKPQPTDLRELLDAVIERYRDAADAGGRAIQLNAPIGLVANVDPVRIRQAVGNLIDNALRHGDGAVVVGASRDGDSLALSVSDSGPGFPADFVGRAFERFTRPDGARSRGGAGLGLAIVQATARAHGGEARIVAGEGAGATIVLTLPVLPPRRFAALTRAPT